MQLQNLDIPSIITFLTSQNKLEGIQRLEVALLSGNPAGILCRPDNSPHLSSLFQAIKTCLTVPDSETDILLRINTILYEMMPDIAKYPNELQPEMAALIPVFIENLGNTKATIRKSTHKCIGTFVKFSKRLESVLVSIIKHGMQSKDNQRTRQHSMLVIPALISLKPQIIEEGVPEMKLLVQEIIQRLKDPAEVVAKTARKLLIELDKCYPSLFEAKFVSSLPNSDDKLVCQLILQNQVEEAQRLLTNSTLSNAPSLMSQSSQNSGFQSQQTNPTQFSQVQTASLNQQQSQRQRSKSPPKAADTRPLANLQTAQQISAPSRQDTYSTQLLHTAQTQQMAAYGKSLGPQPAFTTQVPHHGSAQPVSLKVNNLNQAQQNAKSPRQGIQQLRDLSIVGREIIGSQTMQKVPRISDSLEQKNLAALMKTSQTSKASVTPLANTQVQEDPVPILSEIKIEFGFLDPSLVSALNENNFWSERTKAIEQIDQLVQQIYIGNGGGQFELTQEQANDFLIFIIQLIPDINFKISLASIKLVSILLRKKMMHNKKHYAVLVNNLTEKLSDSKQVVRDATLECCALVIDTFRYTPFLAHCAKTMQHANWHVREGILILIARCLLDSESNGFTIQDDLVEELCFCVKVEEKAALQRMAIDNLGLALHLSNNISELQRHIENELGFKPEEESKEQQAFDQILYRLQSLAFPFINNSNRVEFKSWRMRCDDEMAQAFEKIKQKNQSIDLTPVIKSPFPGLNKTQSQVNKTVELDLSHELFKPIDDLKQFKQDIRSVVPDFEKLKEDDNQLYSQVYPHSAQLKKVGGLGQQPMETFLQYPMTQVQRPSSLAKQNSLGPQQDQKIAIWLPNFNNQSQNETDSSASAVRRINSRISDSVDMVSGGAADDMKRINSKQSDSSAGAFTQTKNQLFAQNQNINKSQRGQDSNPYPQELNLNITSSSLATFVEDGRTTATKAHNPFDASANLSAQNFKGQMPVQKTAIFGDGKTPPSYETQDTFHNAFGQSQISSNQSNNFIQDRQQKQNQTNYTPIQHRIAPRTIQSTQDKQNYHPSSNSDNQETFDTAPTQSYKDATTDKKQINDRLTLLKSSNKYKNNSNSSNMMQPFRDFSETGDQSGYAPEDMNHPNTLYENNKRGGPVKAAHIKVAEESKVPSGKKTQVPAQLQPTQVQLKSRQAVSANKPPTNSSGGRTQNQSQITSFEADPEYENQIPQQSRSNSFDIPRQNFGVASQSEKKPKFLEPGVPSTADQMLANYDIVSEPLSNPQSQLPQAINDLKSSDWSKQFEACSVIRRAIIFHKQLFQQNLTVFKELVKPVESLRSQVSKNACMAMQGLFSDLPANITDGQIDNVLPTLLKRAADTNQFISEQASQTIIIIVKNCSETVVFNRLQSQSLKTNAAKEKVCYCYAQLIEKLIHLGKLKSFPQIDRLVQTVVGMLGESAVDVRQQAKFGVHTIANGCGSQRDMDALMQRCHLSEKQQEQVKKVLKSEDFESLSQYANTRYGALRSSPLQGGSGFRPGGAEGNSDGFQRNSTGGAASQMQNTFISGVGNNQLRMQREVQQTYGNNATSQNQDSSTGFDNTQSTFKMRTTSLSKPVDRQLLDDFKALIDTAKISDWQKRIQAIDKIQDFSIENAQKIKQNQSSFIGLVDAYSRLLQESNVKVLSRCQQSFAVILQTPDLHSLINSNLTMIVQALTTNLCSTTTQVRMEGQGLLDLLEMSCFGEARNVNALVQPLISQVNLTNCRAKAQLVERLAGMVDRVDKPALLERYVNPLMQAGNKIQQEANGNQQLKQALQHLEASLQSSSAYVQFQEGR